MKDKYNFDLIRMNLHGDKIFLNTFKINLINLEYCFNN